ncbi:MAG: DUF5819 family protein [Crocinitomicaceae bacterium]
MPKDTKEIETKKQKRYGWLAFIVLTCHFILVLFSIIPETITSKQIHNLSKHYTDPVFKQKWAMFAPCPTLENRLKVKYYFENDSTDWIDPISNILTTHQTYRLTYHGNIAVGYYNMLYWLKRDLDHLNIETDRIITFTRLSKLRNSLGNRLLHNYVYGYANENFNQMPSNIKLNISYRNIISKTTINYLFTEYK